MSGYKAKYLAFGNVNIHNGLKRLRSDFSLWAGLGLILVILIFSLSLPCPTASQFRLFKIGISIGLAAFAGSLPGFFKLNHIGIVKIGAGLAVFLLAYYTEPTSMIIRDNCHELSSLRGKVIYESSPLANVTITSGVLNEMDITNSAGEFNIPYSGNLNLPLSLKFHFYGIDTTIILESLPEDNLLIIRLHDTIPKLYQEKVQQIISEYFRRLQQEIVLEHERDMYRNNGKPSSLKDILVKYLPFEQIQARYRNMIEFTNGFQKLTTQKNIRASGIQIDPMVPYHAYGLSNYRAFVYHDTSWQEKGKSSIDQSFAFFNENPIIYKIQDFNQNTHMEYTAIVQVQENIRRIRTSIHYSKNNHWVKYQRTEYTGTRPREEFIIRYLNGHWQLFDTKNQSS